MTTPDDDGSLGDLQERIRKGGYRRNADGSYETNEGRVHLESPTEAARRRVYDQSRITRNGYNFKGVLDPATIAAAADPANADLDIDWGIYTPKDKPMTQMHGLCDGGPYDGKPIVHHETPYMVAIEIVPATETTPERQIGVLPAHIDSSVANPNVIFKAYIWDADRRVWVWDTTVRRRSETKKRD